MAAPALKKTSYAFTANVALTSDMSELPIIKIETQAPDVAGALRLANAAASSLGKYLDGKAADEQIPIARRLRVRPLGTALGHEVTRGPGKIVGIGLALFVFLGGCAAILVFVAIARGWRAAVARDVAAERKFETFAAREYVITADPEPHREAERPPPAKLQAR